MQIEKIKRNINSATVGGELYLFDTVRSTNDLLDEMFSNSDISDGAVVITDYQTGGKGRKNRKWFSPPKANLYISILFMPRLGASNFSIFTFLASCSLMDILGEYGLKPTIKWPNDIIIKEKKISGVLTELKYSNAKKTHYLIVGIGVNINLSKELIINEAPEISDKTTSMSIELNKNIDREVFTSSLINRLDYYYQRFNSMGYETILETWLSKWGKLGEMVKINENGQTYEGVVQKVDENGFLYLKNDLGKTIKIISGDFVF